MNIIGVCELLGDSIQISSVKFGTHVIQRINVELPLDKHLDETLTGEEIREKLDTLPVATMRDLQSVAVLSPTEISSFVDSVAELRQLVNVQDHVKDVAVESYIGYALLIMFIVVVSSIMRYVFLMVTNGDALEGTMVTALKFLFKRVFG